MKDKKEINSQIIKLCKNNHPETIKSNIENIVENNGKIKQEDFEILKKGMYLDVFEGKHTLLTDIFKGETAITVIDFINKIIKEYDCNTTLEKSLCEVIGLNYGIIMELSEKLGLKTNSPVITKDKSKYVISLSQELERAHRCYIASINSLIEIKRLKMGISINNNFNINQKEKGKH